VRVLTQYAGAKFLLMALAADPVDPEFPGPLAGEIGAEAVEIGGDADLS
jgi:hypothetical protein